MKRYYFDLGDGERDPDETGSELADDDEARRAAIRLAGEILRDEPGSLDAGRLSVSVANETGSILFVVEISVKYARGSPSQRS